VKPKVESMDTMVKESQEIVRRGKNDQFIGNWDVANKCNMYQYK
jgi:hypothetical protein